MPPYTNGVTGVLNENDATTPDLALNPEAKTVNVADGREMKLVWRNILAFAYLHLAALYGGYLFLTSAKWQTDIFGLVARYSRSGAGLLRGLFPAILSPFWWSGGLAIQCNVWVWMSIFSSHVLFYKEAFILYVASGLGITAGAHRQWAHKSYSAKWPLRVILVMFNTLAFQDSVIDWARDHRMHHKYSETDADPHNATRGFFFSHIGWLLCRKHPEIKEKGKGLDMSDLWADPILRFQKKYYLILMPVTCFIVPTMIPVYLWNESWTNAFFVATMFRYAFILNVTWLVNSAAHAWGSKPYDKFINPCQNLSVSLFALGEGFHNYHHVFPWDYRTAELGNSKLNFTTTFINFFAKIGWAYDLKTVSPTIIEKRVIRTGDGSHPVWGWGDKDQPLEEMQDATIIKKKDL